MQRKGRFARVIDRNLLAQARPLVERAAKLFSRFGHALTQARYGIGARTHGHDLPELFARVLARIVDQLAAAKGRRESRSRQRRLARAAVGDDRDQTKLAELVDEFLDLGLAAEEAVGLLLAHRAQADEGLVDELRRLVPIRIEDRLQKLLQLLVLDERIARALIALGEGRQGFRARAFVGENRNEQEGALLVRGRAREREVDLRLDPVHHAAGADIDDKGGRLLDRLGDLRRPWRPGLQIVLVEPHVQAGRPRVRGGDQPVLQLPRRFGVGAGMAQENEGRGHRRRSLSCNTTRCGPVPAAPSPSCGSEHVRCGRMRHSVVEC